MRQYEGIWRKRQLVPCWILQVICAAIFALAAGLLLAAAGYVSNNSVDLDYQYYGYSEDDLVAYAAITGGVILAFALFTVIFDIIEAILYAKRKLNPVLLLTFACLKTLAWGIYLVLTIVSAAKGSFSTLDFLLSLILVGTSVIQLIFGAKFTHQKRKGRLDRGHYKPTGHVEGGLNPAYYQGAQPPLTYDNTYRGPSPVPSYIGNPGDTNMNYYSQGVEMQPPKTGHY
ncbi:hypothetical protein BJ170DRAFT_152359 [Xylariales sp. AK1849]|nr:hypothetical protein BJ170DRAFT_152359 [Xylariales sp. AK1849]